MMFYRKKKSSKQIDLPLVGSDLFKVGTDNLVTLFFLDERGFTAQLVLEQSVTIFRPDKPPLQVFGTKPGTTFNLKSIEPILNLIGMKVKLATAHQWGALEIVFYDNVKLEIIPDVYEAWHFQKPAPGTKVPYSIEHFSLHGSDGELI